MCEKIDWNAFMEKYKNASHATQVSLIRTHLMWFDTQCKWISCEVWGEALLAK